MESYNNTTSAHTNLPQSSGGYFTTKGTGVYSNPVAITSGNIAPLTNKDFTNSVSYKHGLPRPLKWQYRRGTTTAPKITIVNPENSSEYIVVSEREVKTSKSSTLIKQTMDMPGAFSVKQNVIGEINDVSKLNKDCIDCRGIGLVADYYPEYFLTNNPLPVCETKQFCCNEQKKALLRVRPANTNLPKNYYTTLQQYRQNRCWTYDQRIFNFYTGVPRDRASKPGSPSSIDNMYIANCYPNTNMSEELLIAQAYEYMKQKGILNNSDIVRFEKTLPSTYSEFYTFIQSIDPHFVNEAISIWQRGVSQHANYNDTKVCKKVAYKPNNFQFATQGAVTSSTRTFKLTVTTIEKNVYDQNKRKGSTNSTRASIEAPLIYKSKVSPCNFKNCTQNSSDLFKGNIAPSVANHGISATFPGGQPLF